MDFYETRKRDFDSGKVRILIEGDCAVDYKKIDESFEITNRLDRNRFEIWYMSYNAKPKKHYRYDKFFHAVPYEKVGLVYKQCDILLKSSWLESFSYPPIEMMATGGYCVVVPNGGNSEFLRDGENCLLYQQGDINGAIAAIERICSDSQLREKLNKNGIATAKSRDWNNVRKEIVDIYNGICEKDFRFKEHEIKGLMTNGERRLWTKPREDVIKLPTKKPLQKKDEEELKEMEMKEVELLASVSKNQKRGLFKRSLK